MNSKLGAFARMAVPARAEEAASGAAESREDVTTSQRHNVLTSKRSRGAGDTVALSLRIARRDWTRLHEVAVADGISLSTLMKEGLTLALAKRGLAPLSDDSKG